MKTIRKSVFETNSSSTHSFTISTKKRYNDWLYNNGIYYSIYDTKLVTLEEGYELVDHEDKDLLTYKEYDDYFLDEYEYFEYEFTSPSGDEMVAFGYHGVL